MRISSSTIYDTTVSEMLQHQSKLLHSQQQIASGRKILTPADDPIASSRILDVSQTDGMNAQFGVNRNTAQSALSLTETTLNGVTDLLQDVRTRVVAAGNAILDEGSRKSIAIDIEGRLQELVGLANSRDEAGNYMFSGFQTGTPPFSGTAAGIAYFGDDGSKEVQVSAARKMPITHSGADLFLRVKDSHAPLALEPSPDNAGDAIARDGVVLEAGQIRDHSYTVLFDDNGTDVTFSITDEDTGEVVIDPGTVYGEGLPIEFDGMQISFGGIPNAGDTFTVLPREKQSVFDTLQGIVSALNSPVTGVNLSLALQHGMKNIDNALENVLDARTSTGNRLNEVDRLGALGENLNLQFKEALSDLQDIDYAEASSRLMQQQTALQAAQLSFSRVQGLTLFDYIG